MAFDYTNPTILAQIYSQDTGETFNLNVPDYPYLMGGSIQTRLDQMPYITMSIETDYDRGIRLMESAIFNVGNIISLKLGYPNQGAYTRWYHAIMLQPAVELDPQVGLVAELAGTPAMWAQRTSSVKTYANTSLKDISKRVMSKYGILVYFEGDDQAWKKVYDDFSQDGQTDWDFLIGNLVKYGFTTHVGTDSNGRTALFVRQQAESAAQDPLHTFVMREKYDVGNSVYPINSLSVQNAVAWLPAMSRGLRISEVSRDTKTVESHTISGTTSRVRSTHGQVLWQYSETTGPNHGKSGIISPRGTPDEDEAGKFFYNSLSGDREDWVREAQSLHDRVARARAGIKASITTFGNPAIIPDDLCTFRGLSRRYDGNWRAQSVTHTFRAGDWTTQIEFIAEGYGSVARSGATTAAANPNTKAASPGPPTARLQRDPS